MKKVLVALTFVMLALPVLGAGEKPEMFFHCEGTDGVFALNILTDSYADGSLTGLSIERKGLYDNYFEQAVETKATFNKVQYKPRAQKYKGLEKYVFDTTQDNSVLVPVYDWRTGKQRDSDDLSEYELLLPPRSELEKIWTSISEGKGNGRFKAYTQMRFRSGDEHTTITVNCRLNYKPSER